MYNSFLSIVSVIQSPADLKVIGELLTNLYPVLNRHFSDYEVILVNNAIGSPVDQEIDPLPPELKHNIYLLNLSASTYRNQAILAGLDRSNGDYTVIFDLDFHQQAELILRLFERTQEYYDIVYLRARTRRMKWRFRPFYRIFYAILKHYSNLQIDENALNTRIISRRALNSVLRLRENLRYMKAIYSLVGFRTSSIEVDPPPTFHEEENFSERFKTSLVAITSFTTFLRSLLLWIFLFSFVFLVAVIFNALKVKFTGVDVFGNVGQALSGWTFLVVLISVFFAITCLNLYIMSIYLSNIYNEIKQRPLYLIESIKRF